MDDVQKTRHSTRPVDQAYEVSVEQDADADADRIGQSNEDCLLISCC